MKAIKKDTPTLFLKLAQVDERKENSFN